MSVEYSYLNDGLFDVQRLYNNHGKLTLGRRIPSLLDSLPRERQTLLNNNQLTLLLKRYFIYHLKDSLN